MSCKNNLCYLNDRIYFLNCKKCDKSFSAAFLEECENNRKYKELQQKEFDDQWRD